MESGEYFLKQEERESIKREKKQKEAVMNSAAKQTERLKSFIAPKEASLVKPAAEKIVAQSDSGARWVYFFFLNVLLLLLYINISILLSMKLILVSIS